MPADPPEREAVIPTSDGYEVSVSTCSDSIDCVQLQVGDGDIVVLHVGEFLAAQAYVRRAN